MGPGENIFISPKYTLADFSTALKSGYVLKDNKRINIIDMFEDRLFGFYIGPARLLDLNNYGFATGIMCICIIEFLARIQCSRPNVKSYESSQLFMEWLAQNVKELDYNGRRRCINYITSNNVHVCFDVPEGVSDFYYYFRNGIVHEGRIKNGYQFSYSHNMLVFAKPDDNLLIVNPRLLLKKLEVIANGYITGLRTDYRSYHEAIDGSIYSRFKKTFSTIIVQDNTNLNGKGDHRSWP